MSDINLLPTPPASGKDGKASNGPAPLDEDLALHVPEPLAPEPKPLPRTAAPMPDAPASLLRQKIGELPQEPKPVPAVPVPPPEPPKPQPPALAVPKRPLPLPVEPLPKPPESLGGDTLRVSLITSGAGAGMSELALRRRLRTFLLVGIFGVVLDGLLFGGLVYWRSVVEKRNTQAEQSVRDVDALIAEREAQLAPVRDFQGLAKAAAVVLRNHEHWTRVLELLEERALPNVQFGSLSGADTGTLSFEVRASDYTTLARQVIAFRQDPRVRKVVVGTASADFGETGLLRGARASMTLTVDPSIFDYAADAPVGAR